MPNDDLLRFKPPMTSVPPPALPPEPDDEVEEAPEVQEEPELEQEEPERQGSDGQEPEEQAPRAKSGWKWIGSSSRPEARKGDGVSDLFKVDKDKVDGGTADLLRVDIKKDIVDANSETGDLSDLVDVFEEDVMGMPGTGQLPSHKYLQAKRRAKRSARPFRESPTTSMGGFRG